MTLFCFRLELTSEIEDFTLTSTQILVSCKNGLLYSWDLAQIETKMEMEKTTKYHPFTLENGSSFHMDEHSTIVKALEYKDNHLVTGDKNGVIAINKM